MHDFGTQNMSLATLVKLTNQFLNAAQLEVRCRDIPKPDLRHNLTSAQRERLQDLQDEAAGINEQAQQLLQSENNDPIAIGSLTAQMNLVGLHICDVLLECAQKLLGREYLTFIAPDELRSVSAIELMHSNRASTLARLTKITLQ